MERVELHRFEEHGIGAQDSMAWLEMQGHPRAPAGLRPAPGMRREQLCITSLSAEFRVCFRGVRVSKGKAGSCTRERFPIRCDGRDRSEAGGKKPNVHKS